MLSAYCRNVFEWRDPLLSLSSLLGSTWLVWHWQLYMLPLGLVFLLGRQSRTTIIPIVQEEEETQDEEEKRGGEEEEASLLGRLELLQQRALSIQEGLGRVADTAESVQNIFNFAVPVMSHTVLLLLICLTLLLYLVPPRILLIAWIINKFRKGLRRRRSGKNSDSKILNFLSKVPTNEKLVSYNI